MEDNMQKINFEYLDDDSIDEELKCSICFRPFYFPVYDSQCGHTFCQQCIEIWLENSCICPTCRQYVSANNYMPVTTRAVLNRLSRLRIKCNLCEQTNIENRKKHFENCPKQIIECTFADVQCQWKGKREEFDLHLQTCPFQRIRPIIDQLMNEIKTIRETQCEQQRFIEAFINNGYTLSQICAASPCYLHRPRFNEMTCSLCDKKPQSSDASLHSCVTLTCICKSCFTKHTQKIPRLSLKRKLSLSEENNDHGDDYRRNLCPPSP